MGLLSCAETSCLCIWVCMRVCMCVCERVQ